MSRFQIASEKGIRSLLNAIIACAISANTNAEWRQSNFEVMGTHFEMELWEASVDKHAKLTKEVQRELVRMENLLSPYIANSDASSINNNAGQGHVHVSLITCQIVERALYYSNLSNGGFDISFASIGRHYDYRIKKQPDAKTQNEFVDFINYRDISVKYHERADGSDSCSIGLNKKGMAIDLGGIAKGFAVDKVIELLVEEGIGSAAVSLGGDSRFLGDRGKNYDASKGNRRIPWLVAIKHPRGGEQDRPYALRMPLVDEAFSTSGDYERFFIDDNGERVHHIIDAKTGKSASDVVSVSIIGPRSMDSDALSTTVFVLGVEKGIALIENIAGYDAVIIDSQGKLHYSSGLK